MNNRRPVLVVEDDVDIRENMIMLLESENYTVYSAAHGKEAWDILHDGSKELPALIVLDFFMPVMDARAFLEVLELARKENHFSDVNVILVTAADAQAREGIEGKTVGVLRKPIDIGEFLQIVARYCETK